MALFGLVMLFLGVGLTTRRRETDVASARAVFATA